MASQAGGLFAFSFSQRQRINVRPAVLFFTFALCAASEKEFLRDLPTAELGRETVTASENFFSAFSPPCRNCSRDKQAE
ncbi:MAG: hypothetical protein LBO73_03960 [Holosporaceae bacterium]|jgi:hypothetical protein|nr:hypothetical protein [Holosporaceae bacterium]